MSTQNLFMACKIERGGFSSERTFEIEIAGNGKLVGTANVAYLRDSEFRGLGEDEPGYGEVIRGFVQCRTLRPAKNGDGSVWVEFPSSDVLVVERGSLVTK